MTKRPDYAPLAAPPNPREDEARAAMRAYMQPMLQVNAAPVVETQAVDIDVEPPRMTFTDEEHDEMMALAFECALDEQQRRNKEKQEQDAARISAALARWPGMARYASTARIETLMTTLPGDVLARGEVVTVTIFDKSTNSSGEDGRSESGLCLALRGQAEQGRARQGM